MRREGGRAASERARAQTTRQRPRTAFRGCLPAARTTHVKPSSPCSCTNNGPHLSHSALRIATYALPMSPPSSNHPGRHLKLLPFALVWQKRPVSDRPLRCGAITRPRLAHLPTALRAFTNTKAQHNDVHDGAHVLRYRIVQRALSYLTYSRSCAEFSCATRFCQRHLNHSRQPLDRRGVPIRLGNVAKGRLDEV